MITKRERLILAVLNAVAYVEGWDGGEHGSIKEWPSTGDIYPSKKLRANIAWYERYFTTPRRVKEKQP